VPAEYATIQSAIDAAQPGDEVVIAPGTYTGAGNKNLDFWGKAITVRSTDPEDPAVVAATVIDCEDSGIGFWFVSGEGPDSVLAGLKITNGHGDAGGAVACYESSPTFINCVFWLNVAIEGGGLFCYYASPTLIGCTIAGNECHHATGYANGGGVACYWDCDLVLTNCNVYCNGVSGAYAQGGGFYAVGRGSLALTDCIISCNTASATEFASGGGLRCDTQHNLVLTNCAVDANLAYSSQGAEGGGLFAIRASATLINCRIDSNAVSAPNGHGGGVCAEERGSIALANCTITENNATTYGGGVYCFLLADVTMASCSVTGNVVGDFGGSVCCRHATSLTATACTISGDLVTRGLWLACYSGSDRAPSTVSIANCILWNDGDAILRYDDSAINIRHSNISGGWTGVGNINEDPLFVDPENGDFHLTGDSPCIDAGDPAFVPEPSARDMDGEYRLWDGDGDGTAMIDMGADEFGSHVFGDLNCDGQVDNFDISPFILALTNPQGYAATYPGCSRELADINSDGSVDNFDIRPFLQLLTGD
jgi:hypothetical protein